MSHAIRGTIRHATDSEGSSPVVSLRARSAPSPPPADRFAAARRIAEAWNDDRGDTLYVVVPDRLVVSAEVRRAAEHGCSFAVDDLGLSRPPAMHFFAADRIVQKLFPSRFTLSWPSFRYPARTLGLADAATWTIGVDVGQTPRAALDTAAHEVFHLSEPRASEAQADAYGRWAASRLSLRWAA